MKPMFIATVAAAVLLIASSATQGIMRSIFAPLSEVLEISLDGNKFADATERKKVGKLLETIAGNAGALEAHAQHKDKGFQYVAKSLANDAKEVSAWFKKGRYAEARFTLHNMTENCISCHSSFPKGKNFPGADKFIKTSVIEKLPPLFKARLQVVTRQFDAALDTYETYINSQIGNATFINMEAVTNYVKIAIRVKQDFKRMVPIFQKLQSNGKTARHIRELAEQWLEDLPKAEAAYKKNKGPEIDLALDLIESARARMDFPRDKSGLIYFAAASGALHDYLENAKPTRMNLAKAYYNLGLTDLMLENSFWLSQGDFYLETAIRTAPDAEFAPKAYAILEEEIIQSFTGSAGTNIPEEIDNNLSELRKMIETKKVNI